MVCLPVKKLQKSRISSSEKAKIIFVSALNRRTSSGRLLSNAERISFLFEYFGKKSAKLKGEKFELVKKEKAFALMLLRRTPYNFARIAGKRIGLFMAALTREEARLFTKIITPTILAFAKGLGKNVEFFVSGLGPNISTFVETLGRKIFYFAKGLGKNVEFLGRGLKFGAEVFAMSLGKNSGYFANGMGKNAVFFARGLGGKKIRFAFGLSGNEQQFIDGLRHHNVRWRIINSLAKIP